MFQISFFIVSKLSNKVDFSFQASTFFLSVTSADATQITILPTEDTPNFKIQKACIYL